MTFLDRVTGWPHWSTPQSFLDRVLRVGPIELDPCANEASKTGLANFDGSPGLDGLMRDWGGGLVFVNPPYGREITAWVRKIALESAHSEIIALLPARVDTAWMHDHVFATCDAYVLWRGRIQFSNPPPGQKKSGSTIANLVSYWGNDVKRFACAFGDAGEIVVR